MNNVTSHIIESIYMALHELHVAKSTAGHKQKGSHGNIAPGCSGSSSLLLVYFVAEVTAPLTVPAYVLQRFQRPRLNRYVK